jgi:hypothetical protein
MTDAVFWAAVQGIGTILASIAALIALVIARGQLRELVSSNKLLAASNEAVTESNIALTRPYVVVDLEFSVTPTRSGDTSGTAVLVEIRNDGKTPAHNITMSVDHPFESLSVPDTEGWRKSLADLNRLTSGASVLKSLTNSRPLKFYLDGEELFGVADEPAPTWAVQVTYEDASGREFRDEFVLEVEPWRRAIAAPDQLQKVGKYIDAVAHELRGIGRTMRTRTRDVRRSGAGVGAEESGR